MLDIKFIRENKDLVKKIVLDKNVSLDIDRLLDVDEKRRSFIQQSESLKAEQNKLGKDDIGKAKEIKNKIKELKPLLQETEDEYIEMMLATPNTYSPETPVGKDDNDNKEIYNSGETTKFTFPIKDHITLGRELDIIDTERGSAVSGFRGYYLKNEGAMLSMALIWHCIKKMSEQKFSFMIPPTIVREFALIGSGHFPFGKDEIYQIANPGKLADGTQKREKSYLAGTSEPSLLSYYANSTLSEDQLPVKVCAFSQCYRSEVGSYGKDTKGLYRLHEFMKVEQVIICKDSIEESNKHLELMRGISEDILRELGLPYRVLQICTGDMGAGKYKMYDIETWMPSRQNYGETHSDSNLTDWQSRRLNIFYRDKDNQKKLAYTLNNTVVATPRILIAIIENYQQADGTIKVPDVLRQYLPFKEITIKK